MNEKNKKGTVKMRSIARKISADFNLRSMYVFFLLDVIFVVLKIQLWRFFTEADALGIKELPDLEKVKMTGEFVFDTSKGFAEFLKSLYYVIPGVTEEISAQAMLLETALILAVMFIVELYFVFSGFAGGGKRVRRKLGPLDRLAATAQMISSADFEGDRFQDLEEALERIDASNTDCRVSTGNTELQGIEAAINNLIDRMRRSYIQQARFVSDASHELRTPISVIQGYANMLDRWGKEDEKVLDESIAAIKSESENMSRLVEQLLFLARGDNGKNQLCMETISLSAMMKEIYDEYSMVDDKHHFILKNAGSEVTAYGDYSMLKQTARILADNAVKYTPDGNDIIFSAFVSEENIPAFEVQDTGIGIPAEDIPKVFERFYRSDDARNRKTGGTGLGLSIARWIVDRHKGYFNLISFVDAGTRFTVYLPAVESEDVEEKTE